ncbi:hypothetical protein HK099_006611 [Clydaea vesicula]|uniref:Uncharacterized protein n=1 Tax=Clydaea vesicula TaxID=447962 RepID=A0AAD5TXU2_9FUNG|nr:hypothetical protein HK099_006611 [Clydaea vesicula]
MTKSDQTITEQISQTASEMYNKVKNTVMPEQSKTAGDKLDEGISATKDKKDSAADQTKGWFSEKSDQANNKVQGATEGKPIGTKVKENLEGAKDYVAEKADNVKSYRTELGIGDVCRGTWLPEYHLQQSEPYCFGYPYVESATEGKKLFERYFGILFDDDDLAKAVESDETITLDEKEEEETENELSHRLTSIIREHFILQTALYFFLKKDPGQF